MWELIKQPWPWYTSGALIALIMVLLIYFGKSFGVSSNLRTICAMAGAGKHVKFFDFNWKEQKWNLLFITGALIGGFIASTILKSDQPLQLSNATVQDLQGLGINFEGDLNPTALFGMDAAFSFKGFLLLIVGGALVGFGARYAGGCTSGHAISGLSNMQMPSLLSVVGFFAGGLVMTYFIFPFIF